MTLSSVPISVDTYAYQPKPTKNYVGGNQLRVGNGVAQMFLRSKSPAARGATVVSAFLVMKQIDAPGGGAHQLTADKTVTAAEMGRLNWNNKPDGAGPTAVVSKTNPAAGTEWRFDVTAIVAAITAGASNNGFRIRSNNATEIRFHSSDATAIGNRPYLEVVWSTAPAAPTLLKPSFGVTSLAKWVCECDFTDHSGNTTIDAMQVQVDAGNNFTAGIDFDSGWVDVDAPQVDLAATEYAGLADGATTWWRCRVRDGDNNESGWSDSVSVKRVTKDALAIVNPSSGSPAVTEFTPPVIWDFDGTQVHYELRIYSAANLKKPIYSSGKIKSTEDSHTIPKKVLANSQAYLARVFVWDDEDREGTVGDPPTIHADRTFTVAYDPTIDPPDTIDAAQVADTPFVDVTVTRGDAPDSWTLLRSTEGDDEEAIDTDLDPADTLVSAGVWRFRDWTARPEVTQTYRVRAEVNGKLSSAGPTDTVTSGPEGIWIGDPDSNVWVRLGGKDFNVESTDIAETYSVLGSLDVVRSVMGLRGLSGRCDRLMLRTRDSVSWRVYEQRMLAIKSRPANPVRLVMGDLSIPVVLGDIVVAPHPQTLNGQVLKTVSFAWWQVDEFQFDGSL